METDTHEETTQTPTEPLPVDLNRHNGKLQRTETVVDIKRDTSGITTQYIATGIVNLGAFASGVCVSWSSSALPLITATHNSEDTLRITEQPFQVPLTNWTYTHTKLEISESDGSWVASLLCLGAFLGAVPAGLVSEYFGRKKTLLYLALPLVVSWILVASSPNVYGLYVGRIVAGIAVGAFSVAIPPYVADISEKQIQATLANVYHVQFTCGVLFGYIIGLVHNALWLSFLSACIPLAFFVAFLFIPESPAYLISQGKILEAKAALRYFRGIDNNIELELKELREHMRHYTKNRITFKQIFNSRGTLKALAVSFGLMVFQQLSGIFPIIFYAEKIFKTFALSLNPPAAAIILGFSLVTSTYFSTVLLTRLKRRVLLLFSLITMAICAGVLAVYYHLKTANKTTTDTWVPLFICCIFVAVYASGIGPIPWLMLREIFPSHVTRRATAITAGFHWFLAFGATKLYQNMVDFLKPGWTLWNFAVCCVIGVLFVYFFVPETKDRSLEEIQNEFDGFKKKKIHRHVIEVESVSVC